MPPDHNQQHPRRPHYHKGRRGPDRRGGDRRPPPQTADTVNRDHLDVEQIMREIRARISERHGIELTNQQVQELAARRLEAILDPRAVKPSLMEELRRAAGLPAEPAPPAPPGQSSFDESMLYESPSRIVRLVRRMLNPVLRLLFNPQAITDVLNAQARLNQAAAIREAERQRRHSEWNALHFEILRRLVTETARSEIDTQQLTQRVESLAARIDFTERRVRALEQAQHQSKPQSRALDAITASPANAAPPREAAPPRQDTAPQERPGVESPADGSRRRRRRRRGRRSGTGQMRDMSGAPPGAGSSSHEVDQVGDSDEFGDEEGGLDSPVAEDALVPEQTATPKSAIGTPTGTTDGPSHPSHASAEDGTARVAEPPPLPEPAQGRGDRDSGIGDSESGSRSEN